MNISLSGRFTLVKIIFIWLRLRIMPSNNKFKLLKNLYQNKRCFIVGLGPSLTIEDLDKLQKKGEICFSMNSVYKLFSFTEWRPDYYFISDSNVFSNNEKDEINNVTKYGIKKIIYNKFYISLNGDNAIPYKTNNINKVLASSKTEFFRRRYYDCRFSLNSSKFVYDGSSCIHSILQIAYYMGFSEVYLIGTDCGSTTNMDHCASLGESGCGYYLSGEGDPMIKDYESLSQDMKNKHVNMAIYNATRGGYLEAFKRVELDKVLTL